jgi:peptidyl-prolyl cis-trans isomerase D
MLLLKMRSGIFSYVFLTALVLGTAGLVLMDWTGSYQHAGGSSDVAVIDGQPIKSIEFDRMVRRILQTQKLTPDVAYRTGMIDQIMEMTVMDHLLKKAAYDYGVIVDDKHIARQISKMLDSVTGKDGDKKQTLARLLEAQNMSEAELVENLRAQMSVQVIRDIITQSYYVPTGIAQDLYQYRHEQRSVEGVILPESNVQNIKDPTEPELAAYFETVKTRYTEPENRSFTVAVLTPEKLAKNVTITTEDAKAYYNENQESFRIAERRVLQQALLESQEKANSVLKQVRENKKSLEEAVKDITGSTQAYTGDTGFEKQGLPNELATEIFNAKENSYIGPVKSQLGWHVIFVKSIQPPRLQPFDEVSETIRKDLQQNAQGDAIYETVSLIEDRLAGGEALDVLAKEFGMTVIPLKDIKLSDPDIPALKAYAKDEHKILQSAFSLQDGETSPVADMSDGNMFVIHLDKITPKRQRELKEVRDEVKALWVADKRQKANAAYAKDMLEKLDAKKTTFADIAKDRTSKVQTFSSLSRDSSPPNGMTSGNLQLLMNAEKGKYVVMPVDKGIMIARVTAIKAQTKPPTPEELEETRTAIGNDISQENLLMFVDALQIKYKTSINNELLEQMYGRDQEGQ